MSKSDTIKQRRVDVYLPSLDLKEHWAKLATDAGFKSLSKYIAHVMTVAHGSVQPGFDLNEILEENEFLKEQLQEANDRIRMLEALRDKLDDEVKGYRSYAFETLHYKGDRGLDSHLATIIRGYRNAKGKPKPINSVKLLQLMDINPRDENRTTMLQAQLDILLDFGVIESTAVGYRWCD